MAERDADVRLVRADTAARWATARRLVAEYAASLGIDLGFQDFERELAHLESEYGPPGGVLLLAESGGEAAGCVALRRFGGVVGDTGEMKRLYVVPAARGRGVGRVLAEGIAAEARRLGYARIVLDTLPEMAAARALYASLGFEAIPAYRHNPVPGTSYLELRL